MKRTPYLMLLALFVLIACEKENVSPEDPNNNQDTVQTPDEPNVPSDSIPGEQEQTTMRLSCNGAPIVGDTTIVVSDYTKNEFTDLLEMSITGSISGISAFSVEIERSAEEIEDQFCAGDKCVNGNGELTQTIDFNLREATNTKWFAHYTPLDAGDVTIAYTFRTGTQALKLSVTYRYSE